MNALTHNTFTIAGFILAAVFVLFTSSSVAQGVRDESPSQRATALCPELAKLAEAIALARNIGQNVQQTMDVIANAVEAKPQEIILINQLVSFVYEQPKLTPYEHSQRAEAACFEGFNN